MMLAEKLSGLPALKELTLVGRQPPWPMTDYQMLNGPGATSDCWVRSADAGSLVCT